MKNGTAALQHAQKRVAAAGGQHIGDLISWNTDRIHVSRVDARRVFDLIGLGALIPDVDPATMLSRAAGEMRRPDGIVVNPVLNLVYVANTGSNSVSVIDGATNTVVGTPITVMFPSSASTSSHRLAGCTRRTQSTRRCT